MRAIRKDRSVRLYLVGAISSLRESRLRTIVIFRMDPFIPFF